MGLSREEVEEVKRQHLQLLTQQEEERAVARSRMAESRGSRVMEDVDPEDIERERERIREDVSAQFYKGRGYKKYIDHRGKVLWLPPDEYADRVARRRRNQKKTGGDVVRQQKIQQTLIYVGVALAALAAGFLLAR